MRENKIQRFTFWWVEKLISRVVNGGWPTLMTQEMSFLDVLSGEDAASAKSTADVVVGAEGAIVYEWEFGALQEFFDDQHEVKNAFSAYISHDLREKLRESNVKMIKRHFTIR